MAFLFLDLLGAVWKFWRQMNLFEMENLEATLLVESHWQFRASRALLTAHQLGIFEALQGPKMAMEVAAQCGTDTQMTEKLLIACCALGVTMREEGRFALTRLGRDTLLRQSPRYIGGVLDHGESLWWSWTGLPDAVRTGQRGAAPRPPEPFSSHSREHWIWAMHGNAISGGGQWLARQLELGGRRSLLDVGGGPGTFSVALCQRFPDLRAVVWDVPETLTIAEQVIDGFGMKDRIALQAGDWNSDEFGQGYDCLLMSNVLHGQGSQAEMKLAKAFRALAPGGLFIAQDFLLSNDKSGPLPAALFNLMVGAYSIRELLDLIRSSGFEEASLSAYNGQRGSGLVTARRP